MEGKFERVIADKLLLFSESAMIRAPNSLIVVRLRRVVRTPSAAVFQSGKTTERVRDAQSKSPWHGDMKGIQCKLARIALGWGVLELASAASVSTQTVTRLERGDKLRPSTLSAIQSVLEANGIEFIPEDSHAGVGIRLKRKDTSA